jgi:hypothetical protein
VSCNIKRTQEGGGVFEGAYASIACGACSPLDGQIADFEKELAKLREVEDSESELQAEIREAERQERLILADRASEPKQNSERLHRQRAHTDVLRGRLQNTEKLWENAFTAGVTAKKSYDAFADAFDFLLSSKLRRNPLDPTAPRVSHRQPPVVVPLAGFAPMPADRRRRIIHSDVEALAAGLRPAFEALGQDIRIHFAEREKALSELEQHPKPTSKKTVAEVARA